MSLPDSLLTATSSPLSEPPEGSEVKDELDETAPRRRRGRTSTSSEQKTRSFVPYSDLDCYLFPMRLFQWVARKLLTGERSQNPPRMTIWIPRRYAPHCNFFSHKIRCTVSQSHTSAHSAFLALSSRFETIALLGVKFSFSLPFSLLGTNVLLASPATTVRALELLIQTSTTLWQSPPTE
jgi:hypothetical protein